MQVSALIHVDCVFPTHIFTLIFSVPAVPCTPGYIISQPTPGYMFLIGYHDQSEFIIVFDWSIGYITYIPTGYMFLIGYDNQSKIINEHEEKYQSVALAIRVAEIRVAENMVAENNVI